MLYFIGSACAGIVVGIFSGMLGIGGGTLMVPLFRLGFGLEAIQATATSLFAIVPTSISGVVTHLRNKTCDWRVGLAAGIGGACTSPIGVMLAEYSPSWLIMLIAACIIGWSAYTMLKKAFKKTAPAKQEISVKMPSTPGEPLRVSTEEAVEGASDSRTESVTWTRYLTAALIGVCAGLASGYVGVGGGFLMVPAFIAFLHLPMKVTSGTSLVGVCILAIPGVITQCMLGNVDYIAGLAMIVGAIPGAVIGGNLVKRIPERQLRLIFGIFLLFAACMLVVNEIFG